MIGEKRLISEPEYEWEMRQTPLINEAPQVIIKDETVNLVYSASGSWDNDYALGLMTLDVADDPLERANWQKEPEPIFQQTNTVYGPGHNGFAKSKDGSEDWLIYHAARWDHSGWDRSIRLQKFGWDQEDKVLLEAPLDEWHVQALPKAEPNRLRLTASRALLEGDLALVEDEAALSKKVVQGFESTTDKIIFTPQIEESDEFLVIAYVKTTAHIPNLIYLAPTSKEEYLAMLDWSLEQTNAPVAIRVPVGPVNETAVAVSTDYSDQKNEVTQAGTQVAIVGVGNFYALAEEIADQLKMQHGITPTVINPKFISGVDKELLDAVARSHKLVVTLEDGIREGGYGQMIASYLGDREIAVKNYGSRQKGSLQ